jgi:hypothetical protein
MADGQPRAFAAAGDVPAQIEWLGLFNGSTPVQVPSHFWSSSATIPRYGILLNLQES